MWSCLYFRIHWGMILSGLGFLNPSHMLRNINNFSALLYVRQHLQSCVTGLDGWNLASVSLFWRYCWCNFFLLLFFIDALAAQIVRLFINFWNLEQNIQTQSSLHWLCSWKGLALGVTRAPQRRLIMQSRSQTWSSTGASSLKKSFMWTLALWKKISWKMSPMMSTARWNARVRFWQYLWLVCHSCQRVCAPILFTGNTCSTACWATRLGVKTRVQVG